MAENVMDTYQEELRNQVEQERAAVRLVNYTGSLLYDQTIELVLYRNPLVDASVSEVLQLHDYAKQVVKKDINIFDSADLAEIIVKMDLAPAKLDIGKLTAEWVVVGSNFDSKEAFLASKLGGFTKADSKEMEPRDVVLYGFGRIGRLAARELVRQFGNGQQLRLRAIVTRKVDDKILQKRAALWRNDSVHGKFPGSIKEDFENKALIVNGQRIHFIEGADHKNIDYTAFGINNAILIDNTGVFRDRTALSGHLEANGISKVILTAPGKEVPNIVYGLNHKELDLENENVYSAASCTTNAIAPVLKVVNDAFGIEQGHIETIHAYTNDQNLLDNMHKKERRGRSAAINMVITETGAGKAINKVLPELANKFTANAVRVPTPNGSLAVLSLTVNKDVSVEEVNEALRSAALEGELVNQINYQLDTELVSNDIIGNSCCSVFDSNATLVHEDKRNIVLYAWYDNEFGYTKQVIRLAKYVAKVRRLQYY